MTAVPDASAAPDPGQATEVVLAHCHAHGFALAGVAPAVPSPRAAHVRAWLEAGRHGSMAWMERAVDVRIDPRALLEGARSVVCVAARYHDGASDPIPDRRAPVSGASEPVRGRIARYARGDDYHRVLKRRLHAVCDALLEVFPGAGFRACVDTAPILEREVAAAAGLGSIGKHTLLIEPGIGSWMLLGEIVTTLDLAPTTPVRGSDAGPTAVAPDGSDASDASHASNDVDAPRAPDAPDPTAAHRPDPDVCRDCTRCLDACPTDCITPWSVDASRCVSTLTIEHRDRIDPSFHAAIGDWIFGCDVCQEVCPHNRPTRRTRRAAREPALTARQRDFDVRAVLDWTEDDRRAAFQRSAMKRATLPMMRRNALIVAGNALLTTPDAELEGRVRAIASDPAEDPLVRTTAQDVVQRLDAAPARPN